MNPSAESMPGFPRPPLAAIVAGGRSRRFGALKAFARLEDKPLVEWVRDALLQVVPDPVLIANHAGPFGALGLPCRGDTVREAGPLGGIHAALLWAAELDRPGALCVGVDMPYLDPRLLKRLLAAAAASDAAAVIPESCGPLGIEPLCAFYRTAALAGIERCLTTGRHTLGEVAAVLGAEYLPLAEVRSYGDPEVLFYNINTRQQHERAGHLRRRTPT